MTRIAGDSTARQLSGTVASCTTQMIVSGHGRIARRLATAFSAWRVSRQTTTTAADRGRIVVTGQVSASDLGGGVDERRERAFRRAHRLPDPGFGKSEDLVVEAGLDPRGHFHNDGNSSCQEHSRTLA